MRTLLILLALAVLGTGALFVAWRMAGKLPREAGVRPTLDAAPQPGIAPDRLVAVEASPRARSVELEPDPEPEPIFGSTPPPVRGLEEGGSSTAGRPRADYLANYADFARSARVAAAARLADEIRAARAELDEDERGDLTGRLANQPRAAQPSARVAHVLALIDEREWLVENLSLPGPEGG